MFKIDTCCTLVPYFEVQEGKIKPTSGTRIEGKNAAAII